MRVRMWLWLSVQVELGPAVHIPVTVRTVYRTAVAAVCDLVLVH